MSERLFSIHEVLYGSDTITESELKRRLAYIRSTASEWVEYDHLIQYLVHGEEKEGTK